MGKVEQVQAVGYNASNDNEIFVKRKHLTYTRIYKSYLNSHVETPQAENDSNDDYVLFRPQEIKQ